MSVRLIPVLDFRAGLAVHALGGDRAHYLPIRSVLHPGSDALAIASAVRSKLGLRELYVADLDAIAGAPPNVSHFERLHELGLSLWVDAGLRDAGSLSPLLECGVETIVAGLETVASRAELQSIVERAGVERVAFSLDLRGGSPVCRPGSDWGITDALDLARDVVSMGVRRLILLDFLRMGTGLGVGTLPLLERFSRDFTGLEVVVGGGISGGDEVVALQRAGASAVLVGSALHDGRIDAHWLAGVNGESRLRHDPN